MTDINAIIQAVLDTGRLGLPEGSGQAVELGRPVWTLNRSIITQQQAHDLIAMHWARNRPTLDAGQPHGVRFVMALMRGDSDTAIRAIYEALCGGKE